MARPALEVADIFRGHGAAWRAANAGHVSLGQLKVMSAIEDCRTAALGGHVARRPAAPVPRAPRARLAPMRPPPTTAAAPVSAPRAREGRRASGSPSAR